MDCITPAFSNLNVSPPFARPAKRSVWDEICASSNWPYNFVNHRQEDPQVPLPTEKYMLKLKPKEPVKEMLKLKKNDNSTYKKLLFRKPRKNRKEDQFSHKEPSCTKPIFRDNVGKTMLQFRNPSDRKPNTDQMPVELFQCNGSDGSEHHLLSDEEHMRHSTSPPTYGGWPTPPSVNSSFDGMLPEKKCHVCFGILKLRGDDSILSNPDLVAQWYGHDTLDRAGNVVCPKMLRLAEPPQPAYTFHNEPKTAWANWSTWFS